MLPFMLGDKKKVLGAIIKEKSEGSEESTEMKMQAMEAKARHLEQKEASLNLIQAIQKNDPMMLRMALKSFIMSCYEEQEASEEEGD